MKRVWSYLAGLVVASYGGGCHPVEVGWKFPPRFAAHRALKVCHTKQRRKEACNECVFQGFIPALLGKQYAGWLRLGWRKWFCTVIIPWEGFDLWARDAFLRHRFLFSSLICVLCVCVRVSHWNECHVLQFDLFCHFFEEMIESTLFVFLMFLLFGIC